MNASEMQVLLYYVRRRYFNKDRVLDGDGQRSAYTVILVNEGTITVHFGTEAHTLRQGDAVITGPGACAEVPRGCRLDYLCADFSPRSRQWRTTTEGMAVPLVDPEAPLQPSLDSWWQAGEVVAIPGERIESLRALIDRIRPLWWKGGVDFAESNAQTQLWLVGLWRSLQRLEAAPEEVGSGWLAQVRAHLARAAVDGEGVEDVARRSGLSRGHFSKRFREMTGIGPGTELERLRLTRACRLLAEGEFPIAAVAYRSGFGTASSFARCFKRKYGVTPREWQHQHRLMGS